jgi:hypothetical protein
MIKMGIDMNDVKKWSKGMNIGSYIIITKISNFVIVVDELAYINFIIDNGVDITDAANYLLEKYPVGMSKELMEIFLKYNIKQEILNISLMKLLREGKIIEAEIISANGGIINISDAENLISSIGVNKGALKIFYKSYDAIKNIIENGTEQSAILYLLLFIVSNCYCSKN